MDTRLAQSLRVLQIALGLTATLAGLDKFFNVLADWSAYLNPTIAGFLPFSAAAFMRIVGVVELGVGLTILAFAPRIGAYVASAWLLLVAVNLALAGHLDVAVRDVVIALAAFTVARAVEARSASPAAVTSREPSARILTA